ETGRGGSLRGVGGGGGSLAKRSLLRGRQSLRRAARQRAHSRRDLRRCGAHFPLLSAPRPGSDSRTLILGELSTRPSPRRGDPTSTGSACPGPRPASVLAARPFPFQSSNGAFSSASTVENDGL